LFLAVSIDGNPLDGFLPTYHLTRTNVGQSPRDAKLGFNRDAIFISYNDFGASAGAATVAAIDKAAALSGTLTYYVSHPQYQLGGMPPAQMHGKRHEEGRRHEDHDEDADDGGVEWFVSTDSSYGGGSTIRVTMMTNYLSSSPNFTYTSLPVTGYRPPSRAGQPGGGIASFPNTITTQVHYRRGHLVTAMASGLATDGFEYPKGLYYQIDVSEGTPVLLQEGVIDPGPGVAVQVPSVDEDRRGNLGLTWIESSSTEYASMWVGIVNREGELAASVAAPGGSFFYLPGSIGNYSTTVLDPSRDGVFWSANEYIGSVRADLWRTHITSFSVKRKDDDDRAAETK
jgi:hypothetical protein